MRKCAVLGASLGVASAALANTVHVSLELHRKDNKEVKP